MRHLTRDQLQEMQHEDVTDFSNCDFSYVNLAYVNLSDCNLRGAHFHHSFLNNTDFSGSDLTGADFTDAELHNIDISHCILDNVKGMPEVPLVENIDEQILEQIALNGECFDMSSYHRNCNTTHCRAGWAVILGGRLAKELEKLYSTNMIGALIYHKSTGRVPRFFANNTDAIADMKANAKGL